MPEQADEIRNPCLIIKNNGGKKNLQYGFKNTHKHTKQKMSPPYTPRPLVSAGDCRGFDYTSCFCLVFFCLIELRSRDHFSHVTPIKEYSLRLHSTHLLHPDVSPKPPTKYFAISFTGEATCN